MRKHSMQNIIVFLIFCMFAILSLVLVVVGIKFYKNISTKTEENTQVRNTCAYLENKIRSNDKAGTISIQNVNGVDVLVFQNENDSNYETIIFAKDGKLKECIINKQYGIDLSYGDEIADVDSMNISRNNNLINIKMKNGDTDYEISEYVQTVV